MTRRESTASAVRLMLVAVLALLQSCTSQGSLANDGLTRFDQVEVVITKVVHDVQVGGITDLAVVHERDREHTSVFVAGTTGLAVYDLQLTVQDRFPYARSSARDWVARKIVSSDDSAGLVFITGGEQGTHDLVAHGDGGELLWQGDLAIMSEHVEVLGGRDGHVYICVIGTPRNSNAQNRLEVFDLHGTKLVDVQVPKVNDRLSIGVWKDDDGDRVVYGSRNRVVSVDEQGGVREHYVGSRFTWINGIDLMRDTSRTGQMQILVGYSAPADVIGSRKTQREFVLDGIAAEARNGIQESADANAFGRTAGTRIDSAGALWAQLVREWTQSPAATQSQQSVRLLLSRANGELITSKDLVPSASRGLVTRNGSIAIVRRSDTATNVAVGIGDTLWLIEIRFQLDESPSKFRN